MSVSVFAADSGIKEETTSEEVFIWEWYRFGIYFSSADEEVELKEIKFGMLGDVLSCSILSHRIQVTAVWKLKFMLLEKQRKSDSEKKWKWNRILIFVNCGGYIGVWLLTTGEYIKGGRELRLRCWRFCCCCRSASPEAASVVMLLTLKWW